MKIRELHEDPISLDYKTSTDYDHLYNLLKDGKRIVVFVQTRGSNKKYDPLGEQIGIAYRQKWFDGGIMFTVLSGSYHYVTAKEREEFIDECEICGVKFINPTKRRKK